MCLHIVTCIRCSQTTDAPLYLMGEGPYCSGCYITGEHEDEYRIDEGDLIVSELYRRTDEV